MIGPDILDALCPVELILNQLGVRFAICGSLSSVAHGAPRATVDVDILAELELDDVGSLLGALEPEYYASKESIEEAVLIRSSFNLIHLATVYKIDVFVSDRSAFNTSVLDRAIDLSIERSRNELFRVQSAEDTIVSKLRWYRLGREVSERQLSDVLGVMRVQAEALDQDYMRRWADELGVRDLLDECLRQAGLLSA
jgi:hypothetical protein